MSWRSEERSRHMFDEYPDVFVWRCDACGLSAEFPVGDFWSSLAELKARGWRITRDDNGWAHCCGKCKAKSSGLGLLDRKLRRVD